MAETTERITASFVRSDICRSTEFGQIMDCWSTKATGDWTIDCATGRGYAEEMLNCIRTKQNPTGLGHIVKAMVGHGQWGGVEVGFFQRVSEEILRTQN